MFYLIANFLFLICIFVFCIFMTSWAYLNGEYTLMYIMGTGILFVLYIEWNCMKLFSKLEIKEDSIVIKNFLFGKRTVYYAEIESWKVVDAYRGINTIVMKLKKRTLVVCLQYDPLNYERLRAVLDNYYMDKKRLN